MPYFCNVQFIMYLCQHFKVGQTYLQHVFKLASHLWKGPQSKKQNKNKTNLAITVTKWECFTCGHQNRSFEDKLLNKIFVALEVDPPFLCIATSLKTFHTIIRCISLLTI